MKKRNIGLLLLSLLAMVHTARAEGEHWTWNPNQYPNNTIFIAVITIDGVEQRSDQLEIGAFYEETCRGSVICEYEQRKDRYFAYLVVNGENGMVMNFRLWDHATETELDVTCEITYTYVENQSFGLPSNPYVFPFTTNPTQVGFIGTVNELWSVAGNWVGNALPTNEDIAVINAPCQLDQDAEVLQLVVSDNQSLTVMEGYTLTAGSIDSDAATKLVVADGGQLVCDNMEGVYATIQKSVEGYGTGDGNWYFIASPLVGGTSHGDVGNLVNEDGFDLFIFDQTEELEWRNYKIHDDMTLNPGEGYLYANKSDAVLEFSGELNGAVYEVPLYYGSSYILAGWNLIGNSNTFNVYADRSYYVLNDDRTSLNPTPVSKAIPIAPCTGIMVKASSTDEKVSFSPTASTGKQGYLRLLVSSAERGASSDCAVISFDPNDALGKYVFNSRAPQLSISEGGKDYAIATAEMQDELPVSFKASRNGVYTLSVNASEMDFDYLHLVDHLTGDEVDLLETPSYTFNARTTDYALRFKIVFDASAADSSESFAFYNGTEWVVNNEREALLQVVDLSGHVLYSEIINGTTAKHFDALGTGVYMMRLINGNDVKVQKIVVR